MGVVIIKIMVLKDVFMMDVETITKTITIITLFTTIMVMILDKIYSKKVLFSPPLIPFQISGPIIGL
jgi:hypothetical protein